MTKHCLSSPFYPLLLLMIPQTFPCSQCPLWNLVLLDFGFILCNSWIDSNSNQWKEFKNAWLSHLGLQLPVCMKYLGQQIGSYSDLFLHFGARHSPNCTVKGCVNIKSPPSLVMYLSVATDMHTQLLTIQPLTRNLQIFPSPDIQGLPWLGMISWLPCIADISGSSHFPAFLVVPQLVSSVPYNFQAWGSSMLTFYSQVSAVPKGGCQSISLFHTFPAYFWFHWAIRPIQMMGNCWEYVKNSWLNVANRTTQINGTSDPTALCQPNVPPMPTTDFIHVSAETIQ